jgi:hypothetical protein
MTEVEEEAKENPVPFVLKVGGSFSAAKEVSRALGVIAKLDSTPATDDEAASIKKTLGPFPPDLVTVPLAERMRQLGRFSLEFTGDVVAVRYDGTAGSTTCVASYDGNRAADAGPKATMFPGFVSGIGVPERGKVDFTVTIRAKIPKADAVGGWTAQTLGGWVETLAHELILHGEPYVDTVLGYRAGAGWPDQLQDTQHWMFIYRCLPRYLLWLRRLKVGWPKKVTDEFVTSLRVWAEGKTTQPPSVNDTLNGTPEIYHLRELAPLLRLESPSENDDNAALIETAKGMLSGIAAKKELWWLSE